MLHQLHNLLPFSYPLLSLSLSPDAVHGGYFGVSNTTPLYTRSHCTGAETYYRECSRLSVNSCNNSDTDAGVVCGSSKGERDRDRDRDREAERRMRIIKLSPAYYLA